MFFIHLRHTLVGAVLLFRISLCNSFKRLSLSIRDRLVLIKWDCRSSQESWWTSVWWFDKFRKLRLPQMDYIIINVWSFIHNLNCLKFSRTYVSPRDLYPVKCPVSEIHFLSLPSPQHTQMILKSPKHPIDPFVLRLSLLIPSVTYHIPHTRMTYMTSINKRHNFNSLFTHKVKIIIYKHKGI